MRGGGGTGGKGIVGGSRVGQETVAEEFHKGATRTARQEKAMWLSKNGRKKKSKPGLCRSHKA